jgi:hypothetical protein
MRQYRRVARDPREAQQESQKRSVEHLQELYSVVVAIALSLAVDRLLPATGPGLRGRALVLLLALLVTLIPFYHGALRHLDELYGHGSGRAAHSFSVLVDFLLLFLESCAFLALAVSITRPATFAWLFLALLALDVAWAYLTRYLVTPSEQATQETWLKVNLFFGSVLLVILVVIFSAGWGSTAALAYVVFAVALTRTVADYALSWKFYVAAQG